MRSAALLAGLAIALAGCGSIRNGGGGINDHPKPSRGLIVIHENGAQTIIPVRGDR